MAGRRGPTPLGRPAVLVAAAAIAVLAFAAFDPRAEASVASGSLSIATDTGDGALFAVDRMRPGVPAAACLVVTTAGGRIGDDVMITALDVAGALAPSLRLTVQVGAGGGGGSCTGFSGTTVFTGTLTQLAAADRGHPTGWDLGTHAARTFRIEATVPADSTIQGLSAAGRFAWLVVPGSDQPTPPPDASPSPSPTVTAEPTAAPPSPSPPAVPTVEPTATATPSIDRSRGDGGSGAGLPPPFVGPPGDGGGTAVGPGDRAADVVLDVDVVRLVSATIAAVGTDPEFPLLPFLLVAAFLLVQQALDLRDPKLTAAATRRDREVEFVDLVDRRLVRPASSPAGPTATHPTVAGPR